MALQEYLDELVRHHYGGRKQDLARAVGISPSSLSRSPERGKLGADTCILIANKTLTLPTRLLREAGHTDVADALDEMYPPSTFRPVVPSFHLQPIEEEYVTLLRQLDRSDHRLVLQLLRRVAQAQEKSAQEEESLR